MNAEKARAGGRCGAFAYRFVAHRSKSYRQSDSGRRKILTVSATEFIRRFLQHVLPTGFQRVRYFGWMAAAASKRFARIRALLDWQPSAPSKEPKPPRAPFCKTCELKMILTQELPRAP